jgi:hypothetical protein
LGEIWTSLGVSLRLEEAPFLGFPEGKKISVAGRVPLVVLVMAKIADEAVTEEVV